MRFRPSMNWLLVCLPAAAIIILPLSVLIVRSTEQLAEHLGSATGGMLNATIGALPEAIVDGTSSDGQATWFKGIQLLTLYVVLAATVYLLPQG